MTQANQSSSAVVLSGGGGYGAYEVGVMKALINGHSPATGYKPLEADSFAGTSIGSINATLMVAHAERGLAESVAYLEEVWLKQISHGLDRCGNGIYRIRGAPFELVDSNCLRRPWGILSDLAGDTVYFLRQALARGENFLTSSASLTRRALQLIDFSAFVDSSGFHNLLSQTISLDALGRSDRRLQVIATNFSKGKLAVFSREDIVNRVGYKAVLASAAVPGFFPAVEIDGDLHIDGGTMMNTPILPAIHGSDTLHVVYMDPDIERIPIENLRSTIGVMDRLLVTSFAFSMNQEIEAINDFNESLALVRSAAHDVHASDPPFQPLLQLAGGVYQQVEGSEDFTTSTIHRYHPHDDLGGALGFLDVEYDHVVDLIRRGYQDAVNHSCEESGCTIPKAGARS
jgi:predicted acylesterase/phospholipase RssA